MEHLRRSAGQPDVPSKHIIRETPKQPAKAKAMAFTIASRFPNAEGVLPHSPGLRSAPWERTDAANVDRSIVPLEVGCRLRFVKSIGRAAAFPIPGSTKNLPSPAMVIKPGINHEGREEHEGGGHNHPPLKNCDGPVQLHETTAGNCRASAGSA